MTTGSKTETQLLLELEELTRRLHEAEETLEAIRSGGVDALVVATAQGEEQLFTLEGADRVYRVFLESISEGALTLDSEGIILYANEAAARLLSAGRRPRRRTRLRSLRAQGRTPALRRPLRACPARRGQRRGPRCAAGEERRPLYMSLRPLEDRGDSMIVAVLTDLSRAEEGRGGASRRSVSPVPSSTRRESRSSFCDEERIVDPGEPVGRRARRPDEPSSRHSTSSCRCARRRRHSRSRSRGAGGEGTCAACGSASIVTTGSRSA